MKVAVQELGQKEMLGVYVLVVVDCSQQREWALKVQHFLVLEKKKVVQQIVDFVGDEVLKMVQSFLLVVP